MAADRLRRRRLGLLFAGALLGLACGPISAQESSKLEPPDLELYRRWGPLRARPGFQVSNFGYDSNILVSPEGTEVPDYTVTLSPRLEGLLLFGRRSFLTFRERFDYTAYLQHTDQNYPNNRFLTRFTLPAQRAGLFVEVGLDNWQERPTDLQDIRTRRRENRLQAGVILVPGGRTEIEISRLVLDLIYTDPDAVFSGGRTVGDVLDRTESGTEVEVAWRAAGRTKLLLEARLETVDFDSPAVVGELEIDRDGDAWRVLPGVRFGAGGPLKGEAMIGWGRYAPREAALPRFSDWIGELNLACRVGSQTELIATAERLPGYSLIPASPYYLEAEFGLRAIRYVTRIIGLEAAASRGRLTFPGSFAAETREDKLDYLDAGIRFRVHEGGSGERVEYSLRLTHYDRTSNVPGVARSKTTFALGAVVGF